MVHNVRSFDSYILNHCFLKLRTILILKTLHGKKFFIVLPGTSFVHKTKRIVSPPEMSGENQYRTVEGNPLTERRYNSGILYLSQLGRGKGSKSLPVPGSKYVN